MRCACMLIIVGFTLSHFRRKILASNPKPFICLLSIYVKINASFAYVIFALYILLGDVKGPTQGGGNSVCVCVSYMPAMVSDQIEYRTGSSVISRVVRLLVMPCSILYLFG